MSYQLTLTQSERSAFDWVGNRYCGGDVSRLLLTRCQRSPEIAEWDQPGEITFVVPEHIAWEIRDLAEEEDILWPCFAPALTAKLNEFCFRIV